MDDKKQMVEEKGISIQDIFYIIKKHIIAIIAFVVVFAAIGYVYNKMQKPDFKSTGTMFVSYESGNTSLNSDYAFSTYISETFNALVKENEILNKVSENTGISKGVLASNVSSSADSLMIKISYTSDDSIKSKEVVKEFINVIIAKANSTTDDGNGNTIPTYKMLYQNISEFSAPEDGVRVSHTLRNVAIFAAIGVVLAAVYVFLMEIFNKRFKSKEQIEELLNMQVLTVVPQYEFEDNEQVNSEGGNK